MHQTECLQSGLLRTGLALEAEAVGWMAIPPMLLGCNGLRLNRPTFHRYGNRLGRGFSTGVCALSETKPPFDLDRLTVPELATLIEAAQAKRQEKMADAKTALLAEFRDKATELGISLKTLMASVQPDLGRKRRRKGEKVAPKYRNPETGDTWTGRGREPGWIKGKNRAEFSL